MIDIKTHWIRCPVCGNKARNRIREDTKLRSFPLTAEKGTGQNKIDKPLIEVCRFFWLHAIKRLFRWESFRHNSIKHLNCKAEAVPRFIH